MHIKLKGFTQCILILHCARLSSLPQDRWRQQCLCTGISPHPHIAEKQIFVCTVILLSFQQYTLISLFVTSYYTYFSGHIQVSCEDGQSVPKVRVVSTPLKECLFRESCFFSKTLSSAKEISKYE